MSVGEMRDFAAVGVFGSALLPVNSVIRTIRSTAIEYVTDRDALRELLPHHFEPAEVPVVRVSHLMYTGVDYLADRSYNVLSVGLAAVFHGREDVHGTYNAVLWEGEPAAVILGRELQGYAKLHGHVPDAVETDTGKTFECAEFGTTLLTGEVHDLVELTPSQLERLQERGSRARSLGWKYIPGPDRAADPDCDYPTTTPNPVYYERAWSATGSVQFCNPSWEQAPVSKRIVDRLRALPVVEQRRAFCGLGSAASPRATIERLDR
jgi:acetoacetate decarboxylase